MLSNKLTCSLVFVLMLALVAGPALAQTLSVDVDATDGIAAKAFVVVSTVNAADADNGLSASTTDTTMPDLDDLLRLGGTIELIAEISDQGTADATFVSAAGTASPAAAANTITAATAAGYAYNLIITEVMWGLNASDDSTTDAQWVEIYGNAAVGTADNIRLVYSRNTAARQPGTIVTMNLGTADTDTGVVLDVVSTINRFGARWTPLGNSGNTEPLETPFTPATDLVSMYRKINLDGNEYKAKADAKINGIVTGLDGLGHGAVAGSWAKSEGRVNLVGRFVGSPGSVHVTSGGLVTRFTKAPESISATGVIINEVRNDTSEANLDWIELFYNTEDTAATSQGVENWELSIITRMPKSGKTETDAPTGDNFTYEDTSLTVLPKYKMQPGEYLVVYNRDPGKSVTLAGGVNVQDVIDGKHVNKGASHMYVVADDLDLPDTGKFLILLRTRNHADDVGKPTNIKDYIGNGFFSRVETNKFNTDVWPFVAWTNPDVAGFGDNTFASRDMSWARKVKLNANGDYWAHSRADARGHGDDWMKDGFVGAGYDRGRDKVVDTVTSPGTPGYPNIAVNVIADDKDTSAGTDDYAFDGQISISEIMYDAGPRWNLVQWIELYNSSMTETINLEGWEMEIRNESTDIESYVDASFAFGKAMIPPNQTLLLVSSTGTNDVPSNYVYNLAQNHVKELGLNTRGRRLLSNVGFHIELRAKVNEGGKTEMTMEDAVGNVMVDGAARQHMWDLPTGGDLDARQSIVRLYGTQEIGGGAEAPSDGLMETSWNQSDLTGASLTFYGHRDDISTPGFRLGGPLPVSLSKFRPARNDTTGHVDIIWVTESELNNAGFNILRSESKTGEFAKVNVQLVAGHGTTSEQHVYTFTDKTAKPNVVYYYQIEDVSLNGNRTTLTTTRLKGHISASGKLTTTWSNLKAR